MFQPAGEEDGELVLDRKRAKGLLRPIEYASMLLFLAAGCIFGQPGSLTLSPAATTQGGTVSLNLNFTPSGTQPAALQWNFTYSSSDIVSIGVTAGAATTAAAKTISCRGSSGTYACVAAANNTNTIGAGAAAILTVTLSSTAAGATIGVSGASAPRWPGMPMPRLEPALRSRFPSARTTYHLLSVACAPSSFQGSASAKCTVTIDSAAPAGGLADIAFER